MTSFRRRIYPSFGAFWKEFKQLFSDRKKILKLMRENSISPCFRERLMLAVTSVNKCRYCAYGHSHRAVMEGVPQEEIQDLCRGTFDRCPEEELPGLLYAQHWAECSGKVSSETKANLISTYGESRAEAIEMAIRLIQMGNLLGNTFDYFIYKATFGRKGLIEEERQAHMSTEGFLTK
jgi:AhpD family alkylhydroperoxidase